MVLKLGEVVRSDTDVMLSTIKLFEGYWLCYCTFEFFVEFNHSQDESKTYNMYTMFFTIIFIKITRLCFSSAFRTTTTTTTCD